MKKFFEFHYQDCEMCFNFDLVKRFTPVSGGKKTCLTFTDERSIVIEEKYEEVKKLVHWSQV